MEVRHPSWEAGAANPQERMALASVAQTRVEVAGHQVRHVPVRRVEEEVVVSRMRRLPAGRGVENRAWILGEEAPRRWGLERQAVAVLAADAAAEHAGVEVRAGAEVQVRLRSASAMQVETELCLQGSDCCDVTNWSWVAAAAAV